MRSVGGLPLVKKDKYKATLNMISRWLDANIYDVYDDDENIKEKQYLADDSANLKQKIEIALHPSTTNKQIDDGNL